MFDQYINKFMQSREVSGPVWFETQDYIRWRPIANEGKLLFLLFILIFGWIALSDLFSSSFGTIVIAGPVLVILLYILCFLKGRKI